MSFADIVLCAHDAGGAEIISAWAQAERASVLHACVDGPAIAIVARRLPDVARVAFNDLDAAWRIQRPQLVLTATSWASDLEQRVRNLARQHRIPSAAYLDHWVNYRERFGFPGDWMSGLPDEIWCPDEYAQQLCVGLGFPPECLVLRGNAYLDGMVRDITETGIAEERGLWLYVCEPVADHAMKTHGTTNALGYDEFDALRFFLDQSVALRRAGTRLVVRPHPSEAAGKYDTLVAEFGLDVEHTISRGRTLADDVARAQFVVGCESMAMVVALQAGKQVFTSIPPGGRPCQLPFPSIRPFDTRTTKR